MNARSQAIAAQDQQIQNNVTKIEAAQSRSKNALEKLAQRLEVNAKTLEGMLKSTAFKGASNEEFISLVIVANEYQLNPLLKQIYAFPSRGGIVPMVGYDGWLSIVNRHPNYDGYDHNDVFDGDKFIGVESIFYRNDRKHPIKKTVYLEEFKMNTDPWKQKPRHMCQMRSFCQAARLAFGITGVAIEDEEPDYSIVLQNETPQNENAILPSNFDGQERVDPETGEISQEVEQALDRQQARELSGSQTVGESPELVTCNDLIERLITAQTIIDVQNIEKQFKHEMQDFGFWSIDAQSRSKDVEAEIEAAKTRLSGKTGAA